MITYSFIDSYMKAMTRNLETNVQAWEVKIRSSRPDVFVEKGILKTCSKFTGEHPCRSAISIKLFCNSIEIASWHECSPVDLLNISRTPFRKNISGRLLLKSNRFWRSKTSKLKFTQWNFSQACLSMNYEKFLRYQTVVLSVYVWLDSKFVFFSADYDC